MLGDSPFSSLLEVGTAEGEGGAFEVGVGGATGDAAIESSESLWDEPLLCRPLVVGCVWLFWGVVDVGDQSLQALIACASPFANVAGESIH